MSFKISHRPDQGLVCEYNGLINGKIVEAAQNQVADLVRQLSQKPRFLIIDHSKSVPDTLQTDDIHKTALRTRALLALLPPDFFIAMIAAEGLAYGLARMWHGLLGNENHRASVFKTRGEAENWVENRLASAG